MGLANYERMAIELEDQIEKLKFSRRDQFAMAAMQGLLANNEAGPWLIFADSSVKMADALIKELDK